MAGSVPLADRQDSRLLGVDYDHVSNHVIVSEEESGPLPVSLRSQVGRGRAFCFFAATAAALALLFSTGGAAHGQLSVRRSTQAVVGLQQDTVSEGDLYKVITDRVNAFDEGLGAITEARTTRDEEEVPKDESHLNSDLYDAAVRQTGVVHLIMSGADPNWRNPKDYDQTALMVAANVGNGGGLTTLLDSKADVDLQDSLHGYTALMRASMNGHKEIVSLLLDAKASVTLKDKEGEIALDLAQDQGVQALLGWKPKSTTPQSKPGPGPSAAELAASSKALAKAAGHGSLIGVNALLQDGADPNWQDPEGGRTALMQAVQAGNADLCQALLEAKADVAIQDKDQLTALDLALQPHIKEVLLRHCQHCGPHTTSTMSPTEDLKDDAQLYQAATWGDTSKVMKYIWKGTDPNWQNPEDYNRTALQVAAQFGFAEVCGVLLDAKADVDFRGGGYGYTALMRAANQGHTQVTELLLKDGANLNLRDDNGQTALMLAAQYGHSEVCKQLIKAQAKVNVKDTLFGYTALMQAAIAGHRDVIDLLVDAGADTDAKESFGDTVVDLAADSQIKKFIENRGGKKGKAKERTLRLSHTELNKQMRLSRDLYEAANLGDGSVASRLIREGAEPTWRNPEESNQTALFAATQMGAIGIMTALLDAKADINARESGDGRTSLLKAAAQNQTASIAALIAARANVDVQDANGNTALMLATQYGYVLATSMLATAGANLDLEDAVFGYTALMRASIQGHKGLLGLLLDAKADVGARTDDGATAMDLANGDDTRKFLQDRGHGNFSARQESRANGLRE